MLILNWQKSFSKLIFFEEIVPLKGNHFSSTYYARERLSCKGDFYLFGVLHRFQHCTGHITMGSWKGRGNQCIQFVRVLYCKLLTNNKQLPAFPLEAVPGIEPRPQRWEARVLPLCHHGPSCNDERSLTNQVCLWLYPHCPGKRWLFHWLLKF